MGLVRTLLAISVVIAHSWPDGRLLVGGETAVQLFYLISGFLISYVLTERQSYDSVWRFYVNRYLRLYPIYAVVALLTLAGSLLVRNPLLLDVYRHAPPAAIVLLVASNTLIFGQDWVMFSGVHGHTLVFAPDFYKSDVLLYQGLLIPQAWTLGVELTFYLAAPFILTRRRTIVVCLVLSLALRGFLLWLGYADHDPWTYRFFPTELALFLCGALAHQFLLPFYRGFSPAIVKRLTGLATFGLVALLAAFPSIPAGDLLKKLILIAAFTWCLPLLFLFKNNIDRKVGELSYPIYICHMLIIWIIRSVFKHFGYYEQRPLVSAMAIFFSVCFAMILVRHISDPVERVRSSIKTGNRRWSRGRP